MLFFVASSILHMFSCFHLEMCPEMHTNQIFTESSANFMSNFDSFSEKLQKFTKASTIVIIRPFQTLQNNSFPDGCSIG